MDPLVLANQILTKIKNNQHEDASVDLLTLLENNAMLGDKWGALARLAITIGERKMAVQCAIRYFNVNPGRERMIQVAGIYAEAGQLEQAEEFITSRLNNKIDFSSMHLLGTIYGQLGKLDKSFDCLTKAIQLHPLSGVSWLTLSAEIDFKEHPKLTAQLDDICSKVDGKNWQNDGRLYFAQAKAKADLGDKEQSMALYKKANGLFESNVQNRPVMPAVENITRTITAETFRNIPTPLMFTDRPTFIVGLPRSGTTLLEQIITSHSEIVAGGELNAFGLALGGVGQRSVFQVLGSQDKELKIEYFDQVLNRYLHLSEEQFGYQGRFVDKTLSNNRQLGIIAKIFPTSPIIMIKRKPEDVAWSAYRACFNDGSAWTWSPARIAEYIKAEEKLFNHWLKVIPSRILEVQYEDLLNDFDVEVTRIMNYLGLPFEEQQKEFYKSQNSVTTSSVAQVRKPIDASAAERSKDANAFVEEFLTHYNQA